MSFDSIRSALFLTGKAPNVIGAAIDDPGIFILLLFSICCIKSDKNGEGHKHIVTYIDRVEPLTSHLLEFILCHKSQVTEWGFKRTLWTEVDQNNNRRNLLTVMFLDEEPPVCLELDLEKRNKKRWVVPLPFRNVSRV